MEYVIELPEDKLELIKMAAAAGVGDWVYRIVAKGKPLASELEKNSKKLENPTPKNDLGVDCISREQAKAAIRDKFKDLPSRVEINTILNELPSVTPQEPKIGHWLMPDKNYSPKIWRKCSCCGTHLEKFTKYISFDGGVHYIENIMNYCRICGADMREVEE